MNIKQYQDKKRSELSDTILIHYYGIIFNQCKRDPNRINTLLEYVNEMCYRGLTKRFKRI